MQTPDHPSAGDAKTVGATHESRSTGRLRVIDIIRQTGEIARVDISKSTGFSPATVTAITTELLSAGLIEPVSQSGQLAKSTRGRPREALRLRGAAKLIAGVKVATDAITVLLIDFSGAELGHFQHALTDSRFDADMLNDQIIEAVKAACADCEQDFGHVSGISIGLAGMVDGQRGYVHWSSSLNERNVDLAKRLASRVPCHVFIENDANLIAKAEQLFGQGRNCANFLVVTIEHGIGMGIVINGRLYRGARGCGAEFGHTKVMPEGATCQCGQLGCLEAYTADYAVLAQANAGGARHYQDIAELSDAAAQGDANAARVMQEAGRYFAMGLANLVNVFDPELLIIASKNTERHPLCADWVFDAVKQQVVQVDAPMPPIAVNCWGDLIWAKGAAAYGLEQISALSVTDLSKPERAPQTA